MRISRYGSARVFPPMFSERNLHTQRYQYYVTKGVDPSSLAPMYDGAMNKVHARVKPDALLLHPDYKELIGDLEKEVSHDYQLSIRRAIGSLFVSWA